MAPIENPINRDGHNCPSNAIIRFCTEYKNNIDNWNHPLIQLASNSF
jgi:hypothetical protein